MNQGNAFLKIVTFMIPVLLANYNWLFQYIPVQDIGFLNQTSIKTGVSKIGNPGLNNILLFVLVGFSSMTAITVLLKLLEGKMLKRSGNSIQEEQKKLKGILHRTNVKHTSNTLPRYK